jgi:DNA-binding CsgD family transcriptional regulator
VDDDRYQTFFLQPTDTTHRHYEVLRAIFVEHQPMADVAQRLGYRYDTVRTLVSSFRRQFDAAQVPPFSPPSAGADPAMMPPLRPPPLRSRLPPMPAFSA